jgi:hypothetical protein
MNAKRRKARSSEGTRSSPRIYSVITRSPALRDDEVIQPFDSAQGREPVERLDRHGALRAPRDDNHFPNSP